MTAVFKTTCFVLFFAVVGTAYAHGNGKSFEKKTDLYFIDAGYEGDFTIGKEVTMDVSLSSLKNEQVQNMTEYETLVITFSSGSAIQLSETFAKPDIGKTVFTVRPTIPGNWSLTFTYFMQDREIVSFAFPVLIERQTFGAYGNQSIIALCTLLSLLIFFAFKLSR